MPIFDFISIPVDKDWVMVRYFIGVRGTSATDPLLGSVLGCRCAFHACIPQCLCWKCGKKLHLHRFLAFVIIVGVYISILLWGFVVVVVVSTTSGMTATTFATSACLLGGIC